MNVKLVPLQEQEKGAGSRMMWEGLALVVKSVERGITEKGSFPSEAAQHI